MAAIIPQRRSPSVNPALFVVQRVLPCVLAFTALTTILVSCIFIA